MSGTSGVVGRYSEYATKSASESNVDSKIVVATTIAFTHGGPMKFFELSEQALLYIDTGLHNAAIATRRICSATPRQQGSVMEIYITLDRCECGFSPNDCGQFQLLISHAKDYKTTLMVVGEHGIQKFEIAVVMMLFLMMSYDVIVLTSAHPLLFLDEWLVQIYLNVSSKPLEFIQCAKSLI